MAGEKEDDYEPHGSVDPSRLVGVFRSLALFDELYLHMQAMNIAVVDNYLTSLEGNLLREYLETERTPEDSGIFVSALSQMWIFAIYELLRTWRQRVRELLDIAATGKPASVQPPPPDDEPDLNVSRYLRQRAIERAVNDSRFKDTLSAHYDAVEPVFRICESLRVTLAKHEVPKSKTMIPSSPGYGRINMLSGALDFEVIHKDGSFSFISRRDIADALREIDVGP